ncbi:hypothetical protein C0J52_02583, partial [Blattella germanica]
SCGPARGCCCWWRQSSSLRLGSTSFIRRGGGRSRGTTVTTDTRESAGPSTLTTTHSPAEYLTHLAHSAPTSYADAEATYQKNVQTNK